MQLLIARYLMSAASFSILVFYERGHWPCLNSALAARLAGLTKFVGFDDVKLDFGCNRIMADELGEKKPLRLHEAKHELHLAFIHDDVAGDRLFGDVAGRTLL